MIRKAGPRDWADNLPPGHEMRWHNHDSVVVDLSEGSEYKKLLEQLRKETGPLNKLLEQKLRDHNLPYSTREGNKILRIDLQLAPIMLETGFEVKKAGKRFTVAEDEITIFFHYNLDGTFETARLARNPNLSVLTFSDSILFEGTSEERAELDLKLKALTESHDHEKITDFIIERLENLHETSTLQRCMEVQTAEEALQWLNTQWVLQAFPDAVYRKVLKTMIRSFLHAESSHFTGDRKALREHLETIAQNFLANDVTKKEPIEAHQRPLTQFIDAGTVGSLIAQTVSDFVRKN